LKILLIILGILYIISPYDVLPDLFPFLGQVDDLLVFGWLIYYLWRGRGPAFFSRRQPRSTGPEEKETDFQDREARVLADPYQTLGLQAGAKPEAIRAAYRQACQLYHPDKVSHLGIEFQQLAEKKFIKIQAAYEFLREKGEV